MLNHCEAMRQENRISHDYIRGAQRQRGTKFRSPDCVCYSGRDWTRSHSGARLGTRYARLFATQSFPQKLLLSQNFCVQTRTGSRPALVQKKTTFRLSLFFVLGTGLEPVRPWSQRILSPLCLPFHHPSNKGFLIIVSCNFTIALNDLSFLFFQVSKK